MREFWIKVYIPEFIYWMGVRPVLIYRRIRYGFPFRKIELTQGKFAMVDEKDYAQLCEYKWYATNQRDHFYAARNKIKNGRRTYMTMHRQIMKCPMDMVIDHINHNGLDNRRDNLRMVTSQQNSWNVRKHRGNFSSQYKGVSFDNKRKKWVSAIFYNGKRISIGQFDDEEAAARAYDEKASEMFGEFACLNFES
jgi:hypothetical protein